MGQILFHLSGSIACYKSCTVISRLVQLGHDVQVACSAGALKFESEATLEGLTGAPVLTDTYTQGRMMDHIHLTKWADLSVLCPATANTVNHLAHGMATNIIGDLFLAHDLSKPYIIAPAMNPRMASHPATQLAMERLKKWGVEILPMASGRVACGDEGVGRLADPDEITERIIFHLKGGGN